MIPNELHRRDRYGPLKQAGMSLVGPSQKTLEVMGCFEAHIGVDKKKIVERVYVVKGLHSSNWKTCHTEVGIGQTNL